MMPGRPGLFEPRSLNQLPTLIQGQFRLLDEDALKGHRVAAAFPGLEEITITAPFPVHKRDLVSIILPL